MAAGPEFTKGEVRQLVRLRGEGLSFAKIGESLGRSGEGCRKAWLRHCEASGQPLPETTNESGPPSASEVDVLVDSTEVDGNVTIVKKNRVVKPSELKEMAGLDDDWICTHAKDGTYETPMKLRRKVGECPKCGTGHYVDQPHRQVLYKSTASFKRIIGEALRKAVCEWFDGKQRPSPVPRTARLGAPPGSSRPQCAAWGLWDAHIGMYAFNPEVGNDYDVGIAVNRCLNSIDDMVCELSGYPIDVIYMPIGNDFMHFDNVRQRTTSANNDLDSDSRFHRAYRAATRVLEYMVRRAAEVAGHVDVFYVPGNHDYITSYTLTAWLAAMFKGEPGITVDLNENPQKIKRYGGTALMFEHGQTIAPNQFPLIFHEHVLAHAQREGIDAPITYKEVQVGHKHQKRTRVYEAEIPTNGLKIVTNPALCNVDFYHHSRGLIGEPMKSVEAYRYDVVGRVGSHVAWARDDARD